AALDRARAHQRRAFHRLDRRPRHAVRPDVAEVAGVTERTIVVAEQRMPPTLLAMAREACARAGTDCTSWIAGGRRVEDGLAGRAALAIGVLGAGARRIPGDVAGLVTDQ